MLRLLELEFGQSVFQRRVDAIVVGMLLLFQVVSHFLFGQLAALFLVPAILESRQLLFVPARAYKHLPFSLAAHLQPLVAFRASRVCLLGNVFAIAALPVLADEHFAALSVDFQQKLAALRAFASRQVVVAEGFVAVFDFLHHFFGVRSHFLDKRSLVQAAFGDCGKLLLPLGGQSRRLHLVGNEFQQLLGFRRHKHMLAPLFQQEAVKQLFDNICARGDRTKPARFSDRLENSIRNWAMPSMMLSKSKHVTAGMVIARKR